MIFNSFHATYLVEYTLPTEESLHRIVVYLSSLNEEIPVSIEASVLSTTLQGNVSQESTLQIIESTSTTTTMDSKSAGSIITVDTTGSISFASNILISTVSIETSILSSIILSTGTKKNIDSSSPISKTGSTSNKSPNIDTCSTIFVIQPEQTNYFSSSNANEPSFLSLKTSQVNYENILVYVGIVLVMSLLACIMTLTAGILLYRRGRRKLEIETRNERPTLAATNETYAEIVHEPNQMVLVRPSISSNTIRSHTPLIQEECYSTTVLDENFYEEIPRHQRQEQTSNLMPGGELIDEGTLSSHELQLKEEDDELINNELDLAKDLDIDSSSTTDESLTDKGTISSHELQLKDDELTGNEIDLAKDLDIDTSSTTVESQL